MARTFPLSDFSLSVWDALLLGLNLSSIRLSDLCCLILISLSTHNCKRQTTPQCSARNRGVYLVDHRIVRLESDLKFDSGRSECSLHQGFVAFTVVGVAPLH